MRNHVHDKGVRWLTRASAREQHVASASPPHSIPAIASRDCVLKLPEETRDGERCRYGCAGGEQECSSDQKGKSGDFENGAEDSGLWPETAHIEV